MFSKDSELCTWSHVVGASLAPSTPDPPLKQPLWEGSPCRGNRHRLVPVTRAPLPAAVLSRARHSPGSVRGEREERCWGLRGPLRRQQERIHICGAQTGFFGSWIPRERGRRRMPALPGNPTLPLAECAGTQLAAPTCSYSKQNFTFWVGRIRSLTPPPGPRRQRPAAPRAPHLIPPNP